MGTFELLPSLRNSELHEPSRHERLGSASLLRNAWWFIKLRLIVIAVLIGVGAIGIFIPNMMRRFGLIPPSKWLWILTAVLISANTLFYFHYRWMNENSPRRTIIANIWLQIIVDLMVITVLVHIVGSTNTFINFIYLFHIVLACIFFPTRGSLLVTLFAAILYVACVGSEIVGYLPTAGILANHQGFPKSPPMAMIFVGSAIFVWLTVWYLASTLSKAVRQHAQHLSKLNEQLIKADQDKTQQVIITTHELKAPFANIESNIQVLKFQYWNTIPETVHGIIDQIELGAQMLSERIRLILLLGDLRSRRPNDMPLVPVNLRAVIDAVLEEIEEKAKRRRISIDVQVPSTSVLGNVKQLTILFASIVANAIFYSYEGGRVRVSAKEEENEVLLSIADQGIGIRDDALSHIFNDYYRTKEAAKFNVMSTGIGLAIVKEIAKKFGFRIKVTSKQEKGTTFEVTIPKYKELINKGG